MHPGRTADIIYEGTKLESTSGKFIPKVADDYGIGGKGLSGGDRS